VWVLNSIYLALFPVANGLCARYLIGNILFSLAKPQLSARWNEVRAKAEGEKSTIRRSRTNWEAKPVHRSSCGLEGLHGVDRVSADDLTLPGTSSRINKGHRMPGREWDLPPCLSVSSLQATAPLEHRRGQC
jgi:hypothetical protein